jgi:polyisoprenoid-binding protein YceI
VIVVDLARGETGHRRRDRNMHRDVLRTARFPAAAFRPERLEGEVPASGEGRLTLHGRVELLGVEHELAIPATVVRDGDRLEIRARFRVPYVEWGVPDPSTPMLRVEEHVDVEVRAVGRLALAVLP